MDFEEAFNKFLDSSEVDAIINAIQAEIKEAFLEGYKLGCKEA